MGNPINVVADWLADAIIDKIKEPVARFEKRLDETCSRLDRLESLHKQDAAALEADLCALDDRICFLIGICRRRGYTTAEDRRRVTRMHAAYKALGGNHGEEIEYAAFLALKTEEEYRREKGEKYED